MICLEATQSQTLNVSVSEREFENAILKSTVKNSILIEKLFKNLKESACVPDDSFINDNGDWEIEFEVYAGSHSWFNSEIVRSATSFEKNEYELLKTLSSQSIDKA